MEETIGGMEEKGLINRTGEDKLAYAEIVKGMKE